MALREILAHFGFTVDRGGLDAAARGVEKVKKETGAAGANLTAFVDGLRGAVAGVAAGAFASLTGEIKDQAAALKDTSEQTGLATGELQAWTLAANLGGASANDFVAGLRKVSKELATGVDESGQQSKLFKRLGIDTKDAAGDVRSLSDVLPEIAEKFAGLKSGAEKSALAQQIFGKAGSKLVPILSQGAAGVTELKRQFEELGGGFSQEAIDRADDYDDALLKLSFSFFGLKSLLATQVFPWLAKTVGEITKITVGAGKWLKETTGVSTAVKILAALLGTTLLKALAPFLIPGLKFLAIFLAVDDLIAFLEGKDSVIGAILDKWFGDGSADAVRAWCSDAKISVQQLWNSIIDGSQIARGTSLGNLMLFFVEAGNGFEGLRATVNNVMTATVLIFNNAVLSMLLAWNDFVGKLKLPPQVERALKIDTAGAVGRSTAAFTENEIAKATVSGIKRRETVDARRALSGIPAFEDAQGKVSVPLAEQRQAAALPSIQQSVSVNVDAKGASAKDVAPIRKAVEAGVKQGLADFRAALQNLENRAPAQ